MFDKISKLYGKHIFTKDFGDGELVDITKKTHNIEDGLYVYFHSNRDGEVKLDGKEFLDNIVEVK